jgi:hypothetical protein
MPAENKSRNVPGGQHAIAAGIRLPDERASRRARRLCRKHPAAEKPHGWQTILAEGMPRTRVGDNRTLRQLP